jgi:signal transduction histidine kinase
MVPPSSREMGTTDKDKEMERILPEPEDSKEKILREREAAASEVARMRQTIDRLLKDIKSRMLDLSKEEAERQRVQDEKSNLRLVVQASATLHLLEAGKECSSRWVC